MSTNFAPFRPYTSLELLLATAESAVTAAERAVAAFDETTPRIIEVDQQGCSYITYPQQSAAAAFLNTPETTEVSVHLQLGDLKIVAEFDSDVDVDEVQIGLAADLSDELPEGASLVVGPLIIPARFVPEIVFASVRTMAEAEEFNVHLYGNGS